MTIVFDLSEVLISGLIGIDKRLAPILNLPPSAIGPHFGGSNLKALCIGRITEQAYFESILRETGWSLDIPRLQQVTRENFHALVPGMPAYVSHLAEKHRLILYSDHAREWIAHILGHHEFLGIFKTKVFSFEQQCTKDDPGAFDKLLTRLRLSADEVVFVDDNPANIANAGKSGIQSILFKNKRTLQSILEKEIK